MEREKGVYDYEIETHEDADIRRELFKRVAARNWVMLGLKTSEMTLEDIFLKITMGDNVVIKTKKSDTNTESTDKQENTNGTEKTEDESPAEDTGSGENDEKNSKEAEE